MQLLFYLFKTVVAEGEIYELLDYIFSGHVYMFRILEIPLPRMCTLACGHGHEQMQIYPSMFRYQRMGITSPCALVVVMT